MAGGGLTEDVWMYDRLELTVLAMGTTAISIKSQLSLNLTPYIY